MIKCELIARELDRLLEQDLEKVLAFQRSLEEARAESALPTLAAESALAKDWLAPCGGCSEGQSGAGEALVQTGFRSEGQR